MLSCKLKGHQFDSLSGHMPELQARSPVGGVREATNRCFSHQCFSPSSSLLSSLSENNKILFKTQHNRHILPKLIHRFNTSSVTISVIFFENIDKHIVKFTWERKDPRITRTILKKNKVRRIPVAETYTNTPD